MEDSMSQPQDFQSSHNSCTHLIDEGHDIDQQLSVHAIFFIQDFHGIGPRLATCSQIYIRVGNAKNTLMIVCVEIIQL